MRCAIRIRWLFVGAALGVFVLFLPGWIHAQTSGPPNDATTRVDTTGAARTLRLQSIEVVGNKRTRTSLIEAYIGLHPGDPVDVDVLEDARRRLAATDFFDSVVLSTRPGSQRGEIVLVVDVDERGFPSFETGFGYDDLYGWFVTIVGLRFDNTFGPESRLRFGWRFGYRISGIDLEFDHRLKPRSPYRIGLAGWAYNQDQLFYTDKLPPQSAAEPDAWRSFQQKVQRAGANASLGVQLNRQTSVAFGLSAEVVKPDTTFSDQDADIEHGVSELPILQGDFDKTHLNGVFLRLVRDSRNDANYPMTGLMTVLRVHTNVEALGSDLNYTRGVVDIRKPVRLRGRTVFASRFQIGMTESAAPYFDRFYIGGVYSIRGFRELSLSPTDGDEGFWIYNGELRFPLTLSGTGQPRLAGIVFIDVGQGWQWDVSTSLDDVQAGVGYGVRLKLPWLGTLGLDAGIPLTPGRTGDPYRVHALLGFSF